MSRISPRDPGYFLQTKDKQMQSLHWCFLREYAMIIITFSLGVLLMQALFSPDSRFMQFMSRMGDLLLLNILFLISCIPLVTVGAASAAMYTVCFRMGTDQEGSTVKSFFRAFRDNFRQGTVLWLVLALFIVTAGLNTLLFGSMSGALRFLSVPFGILLILALLAFGYGFPLVSLFRNNTLSTLKNALFLSIGHLPRSLLIALLNCFPAVLLLTDLSLFLHTGFLWAALYFSAAAWLDSLLLKPVFAPYLNTEEEVSP